MAVEKIIIYVPSSPVKVIGVPGLPGPDTGGGSGGISIGYADLRYIKQSQINAANGVAGLDAGAAVLESALPLPPITLTLLFDNQIA